MSDAVLAAFGVTEADLLGSGWESTIYALGATQILRIPRPEAGSEDQVRARAASTANLPPLPFEVPRVREISRIDGQLFVIEDRIAGQSMATLLPGLSGERRAEALRAYLAAADAMAVAAAPDEAFGDLLLDQPRRSEHWSDYLIARLAKHGAEVIDRMQLYAVWFAFDFAFNHDDATAYAWCVNQIRGFADQRYFGGREPPDVAAPTS
jgi:hypothetical protein